LDNKAEGVNPFISGVFQHFGGEKETVRPLAEQKKVSCFVAKCKTQVRLARLNE